MGCGCGSTGGSRPVTRPSGDINSKRKTTAQNTITNSDPQRINKNKPKVRKIFL
jgi:hypothetical protein